MLVHGTWAPGADWTKHGSDLRTALADALCLKDNEDNFVTPTWSGRNRYRSRIDAAQRIKDKIHEVPYDVPLFLIGHSHGGSAIAYLLKASPEICARLRGVVYMSTPFISLRPRTEIGSLLATFIVIIGVIAYFAVGIGLSILESYYGWSDLIGGYLTPFVLFACSFMGIATIVTVWSLVRLVKAYEARIITRTSVLARDQDTCSVAVDVPTLFIRVTGDEAAAALSFWQCLGWCTTRLGDLLSKSLLWSHRTAQRLFHQRRGKFFAGAAASLMQLWLFYYVDLVLNWGTLLAPWRVLPGAYINFIVFPNNGFTQFFSNLIVSLLYVAILFCFVVALTAFFWIVVGILRWTMCVVGLRFFGMSQPIEALFLDFAVEPIPCGAYSLNHVDWDRDEYTDARLSHSLVYLNPNSLSYIKKWVGDANDLALPKPQTDQGRSPTSG